MFDWIRNTQRDRDRKEIAALDDRDLTDIGVTREALEYLVEVDPAVYGRMTRMAARHGLTSDALQADRTGLAHLTHTCDHCTSKRRCDSALGSAMTGTADVAFCPNHAAYEGMAKG